MINEYGLHVSLLFWEIITTRSMFDFFPRGEHANESCAPTGSRELVSGVCVLHSPWGKRCLKLLESLGVYKIR